MIPQHYLYLHGFASSATSWKGQYLQAQFAGQSLILHNPDLNQNDFFRLTLTRQLQQVKTLLQTLPPEPMGVTVIGSSFGGLTAAWLAETELQVHRLVLLAPAFGFLDHWLPTFPAADLARWQQEGSWQVYHYGDQCDRLLSYGFVEDLARYADESRLQRPVPTLIMHGTQDTVIPLTASAAYAASRPWVQVIALADDHGLGNSLPEIWRQIQQFCT